MEIFERGWEFVKQKIWSSWFEWFHFLYASIVIASGAYLVIGSTETDKENYFLIAFLGYFGVLLVVLVLFGFKFARKARYSEAIKCVHDAIDSAHHLYSEIEESLAEGTSKESFMSTDQFLNRLSGILSSFSEGFTLVTALRCRSSIKC